MFNHSQSAIPKCYTEWYDPVTKQQKQSSKINDCHRSPGYHLGIIREQFVIAVGRFNGLVSQSIDVLDVYSRYV